MRVTALLLTLFLCATALVVTGCPRAVKPSASGEEADGAAGDGAYQDSAQEHGAFTEVPDEISVYPGATKLGSGREISVTGLRVEGTIDAATYHVDAPYDEVVGWYRDQLTGERELTATIRSEQGSGRGTIFVLLSGTGVGAAVTVAAADGGPGTTINIGSWKGSIREST